MRLGGTTSVALPLGGFLMTAIVQWGGKPSTTCNDADPVNTCNQSSIVLFKSVSTSHPHKSDKEPYRWKFLSVIADAHDYPQSLEGPNAHDMTFLADGKTLLAVIRLDGGDGGLKPPLQPYTYLNYYQTISEDYGLTWSRLRRINAGCARPRLLLIGSIVILSGGRFRTYGNTSDVLLWVSKDGQGESWVPFSLSYRHNLGVSAMHSSYPLFDSMVNFSGPTFSLPRETNAYTSLVRLNTTSFMVLYDQRFKKADKNQSENDFKSEISRTGTGTVGKGTNENASTMPRTQTQTQTQTQTFSMIVHVNSLLGSSL
jgi:hypothetical protein